MAQRNFFVPAVLFCLLLFTAFQSFASGDREAGPAVLKGVIVYLEGEVLLDGRPAEIGQEATAGAVLTTGAASLCELIFGEHNICRFEENTIAVLDVTHAQGSIDLQIGALAAVFSKLQALGSGGGAFGITTPTAVAGVRGTAFYIKVENPGSTYVCTCNGTLTQRAPERKTKIRVTATNHEAYRFSRTSRGVRRTRAGLLYHDDALMDRLAAEVGTRLIWGGEEESGY